MDLNMQSSESSFSGELAKLEKVMKAPTN